MCCNAHAYSVIFYCLNYRSLNATILVDDENQFPSSRRVHDIAGSSPEDWRIRLGTMELPVTETDGRVWSGCVWGGVCLLISTKYSSDVVWKITTAVEERFRWRIPTNLSSYTITQSISLVRTSFRPSWSIRSGNSTIHGWNLLVFFIRSWNWLLSNRLLK